MKGVINTLTKCTMLKYQVLNNQIIDVFLISIVVIFQSTIFYFLSKSFN